MADLERYWDSEFPRIGDAHPSQGGISRWLEGKGAPSVSDRSSGQVVNPGLVNVVSIVCLIRLETVCEVVLRLVQCSCSRTLRSPSHRA